MNNELTKFSSIRVAREWSSSQMTREIDRFEDTVSAFWGAVRSGDRMVNHRWAEMINSGRKLAPWLIETRSVPPGLAKKFEMAVRLFYSARRSPQKMDSWLKRNTKNIAYFEMALKWPEKASVDEEGDEVFSLAGWAVHNTVHLTGKKLDTTKAVIEKAVKTLKGSGIPNAARAVYGNLFIVGRLSDPRTLAWYSVNSDELYLRPHSRYGSDEVSNLLHEIGHRYWYKLMPAAKKMAFAKYHSKVKYLKSAPIVLPVVGEPMSVPIRGYKNPPLILSDKNGVYEIEGKKKGEVLTIGKMQIIKFLQQESKKANFPTRYASTDMEEHFAEAFALYALGGLKPHHQAAFDDIVIKGEAHVPEPINLAASAFRVASLWEGS